jgi:hypothetical protein
LHFEPTWAIALAILLALPASAQGGATSAAAYVLEPGADLSDCRSALRAGPSRCAGSTVASAPAASGSPLAVQAGESGNAADRLEAQVDAYLAGFSKPPREAVRALLDPSDTNIRAMVRKQDETLAVAAYVAARMTQIQRESAQAQPPGDSMPAADLPALMQMSVTLFQRLGDAEAQPVRDALRALAQEVPALHAQVALVGIFSAQELRAALANVGAPLAAIAVRPDACAVEALPFLRIEDLRFRQVREIEARQLSSGQIHSLIVALRTEARRAALSAPGTSPERPD